MLLGDFQFAKSPLNRLVFNGLSMLDTSIKTRTNFKFFFNTNPWNSLSNV